MPHQLKNRFSIIGITGPLGSGCSTAGKFLSGIPVNSHGTMKELLKTQINELGDLNVRIGKEYKKISGLKKNIEDRLSKRIGPYKKNWIDPNKDNRVKMHETKISRTLSKLKIYLRQREVYSSLKDLIESKFLTKSNLNKLDFQRFGFKPFCYISFTTVIMKLAIEEYYKKSGKKVIDNYFVNKIDSIGKDKNLEKTYKDIKRYIKTKFYLDNKAKVAFQTSNVFMKSRMYQFALQFKLLSKDERAKANNVMSKSYKTFYALLARIDEILKSLKKYTESKGEAYSVVLSEILQDWGDNIRATGNPYRSEGTPGEDSINNLFVLSEEVNMLVKAIRFRIRYLNKDFIYTGRMRKEPDCLFVVECFRNPYEVEYFRSRYSEFYLISISTLKDIRKKRVGKFFSDKRDGRDEGKGSKIGELHKLDVRSCVLLSDIAIINDHEGQVSFFKKIIRYFALIRNPGCIPPNNNELYMHIAYSHSLKSTCISRKVGAVILGPNGYILGAGWNDAGDGQIGCGMRTKSDMLTIDCIPLTSNTEDLEEFRGLLETEGSEYICYKDIMSKIYTSKKVEKFQDECSMSCLSKIRSELGIKRLEYCRALHAEENAILQTSKLGGMPIKSGTIYTTTYPCELCAKKLYQIGVRTIYYTEPYPESISEQVFLNDGTKYIERVAFEGVKSHSYYKLFKPIYDKKELSKISAV